MKFKITCDNCKADFAIEDLDVTHEIMKGNGLVEIVSFNCPKCDSVYVVGVFDDKYNKYRSKLQAIQARYADLKSIEAGPERDRVARNIMNEEKSIKKAMRKYASRLKDKYLKEKSRNGKRKPV